MATAVQWNRSWLCSWLILLCGCWEGERRIEGKHLSIVTRWEGVLSAVAVLYLGAAELLAALL